MLRNEYELVAIGDNDVAQWEGVSVGPHRLLDAAHEGPAGQRGVFVGEAAVVDGVRGFYG